jgi:hypothetical protein
LVLHLQQRDLIAKSFFHLDTFLPFHDGGSFLVFSGCQFFKQFLPTWQLHNIDNNRIRCASHCLLFVFSAIVYPASDLL